MNAKTTLVLSGAFLATVLLAACGGGAGTNVTHLAPVAITTPGGGNGNTIASHGTTTTFTLTIDRAPHAKPKLTSSTRSGALAERTSTARRSPQFISNNGQGIQMTVSSGAATQTLYYGIGLQSPICTVDPTSQIETCTLTAPTVGTTETIGAIEIDASPTNESQTTGQGNAFPSNAHVLAIGTQTLTLTPGAVNSIPFSLDPVVDGLTDGGNGSPILNNNINVDDSQDTTVLAGPRIVVTPNTAATTFANPSPFDASGAGISSPACTTVSPYTCVGQSFVDVNASPVPLTVTSSSSAVTVYPVPVAQLPDYSLNGGAPTPLPSPFAQTASIPDSSYFYYFGCCGGYLAVSTSGAAIPTGSTITLTNGLTATPPVFTGPPSSNLTAQPDPYATSLTYTIVTITALPANLTFSSPAAAPQVVTGSDFGALQGLQPATVPVNGAPIGSINNACSDGGGTTIATIGIGAFASGTQPFTVSPAAIGSCAFVLFDYQTLVVTNTVNVTVN